MYSSGVTAMTREVCQQSQAALAGQSLNEFLLARMREQARLPTVPELARRIAERAPYTGPSSADLVREDRDRR